MSLRTKAGDTADDIRYSLKGEGDFCKKVERIREEGEKAGKTEEEIGYEVRQAIWPQYQEMLKVWQDNRSERPTVPQKSEESRKVSQTVRKFFTRHNK